MQILALAPVATTGWVTTRPCRSLKSAAPALAVPRARHLRVQAFQETPAPPAPAAAKPAAAAEKKEVDHVPLVLEELKAKKKVLIAQTAPAVRIAIGEELGLGPGVNATGKMVSCGAGAANPALKVWKGALCVDMCRPCMARPASRHHEVGRAAHGLITAPSPANPRQGRPQLRSSCSASFLCLLALSHWPFDAHRPAPACL